MRLSQMPEEPGEKDQNACHIVFRLSGSGERIQRRFFKDQTVQALYDYIDSLMGDKVHFESPGNHDYQSIQSMPRKVYDQRDKLLSEVGLFPRAMLIIKEGGVE